jgi:HEAT repeat protein
MKVRESATQGLGKIGDKAVLPLMSALQDGNRYVRESAAQALQRIALNDASKGSAGYLATHIQSLNTLVSSGNEEAKQVLATFRQCLAA